MDAASWVAFALALLVALAVPGPDLVLCSDSSSVHWEWGRYENEDLGIVCHHRAWLRSVVVGNNRIGQGYWSAKVTVCGSHYHPGWWHRTVSHWCRITG